MDNETSPHSIVGKSSKLAGDLNTDSLIGDAMNEFESALIVAYEQALENGVPPHSALAAILNLASSETQRLAGPASVQDFEALAAGS